MGVLKKSLAVIWGTTSRVECVCHQPLQQPKDRKVVMQGDDDYGDNFEVELKEESARNLVDFLCEVYEINNKRKEHTHE